MDETEQTDITLEAPAPQIDIDSVVVTQEPTTLNGFTYSVRHRISNQFPNGPFEGRLRLAVGEFIVSAATMDDVLAAMTVKADSLLRGSKTQA